MIFRAAPAWTIITDTLCVTTSCSSDAIRARSAASARSVAAFASSAARRSRAVESASRRRSTRKPRPAAPAGRIAKTAVSRPGNRGSSLPSVPATATVTTDTTAIARFRYLAVGHRAVGGVDGRAKRDRRHVRAVHGHDRGGDREPDADRVEPPGGERQRGQRGGGEQQQARVRLPGNDQAADPAGGEEDRPAERGGASGRPPRRWRRRCAGHLVDRADRRAHRDGGVERERPPGRRRATRLGPREEGHQPAGTCCHSIIVSGKPAEGIHPSAYPGLHREDDGPWGSTPLTLGIIGHGRDAERERRRLPSLAWTR